MKRVGLPDDYGKPASATPRGHINLTMKVEAALRMAKCYLCNSGFDQDDEVEWDHVVALELGGKHEASNIAPAHQRCHRVKTANDQRLIAKGKRIRGETRTKRRGRKIQSRGFQRRTT